MGNLRQSMTREEWDELGKQSSEKKQQSMKYTIDTQNKTLTIEQCSVNELTDLLSKLKQVHSDLHIYNIVSKTPTTIPFSVPNTSYWGGKVENYVSTTSLPNGTKYAESKL
jgi:hypothetical protein